MQFSELFTALLEHHNNTVVIHHGATFNDTDLCCSPAFRQYSGVIITVRNDLSKPTIGLRTGLLSPLVKEIYKSIIQQGPFFSSLTRQEKNYNNIIHL